MKAKVLCVAFIVLAFILADFTHAQDEYGVQITNTGITKWFTDWSPDGKWITYSERVENGKWNDVFIVPAEGGTPVNLTANIENLSCHLPGFKPNSIEITFTGGEPHVAYTINIETLQHSVIREQGGNAFWSHNGRYLVFPSAYHLSILDTNDGKVSDLVTGNWISTSCFTPDDLYVISTYVGDNALYRIPVEGGTKEQITFHEGKHWYPKCSPDGKWVVYTVWPKEFWVDASLYATKLETGETFRIFPELTNQHYCGSFSPDGSKLCYLKEIPDSDKQGQSTIYEVFVADVNLQGDTAVSGNNPTEFLLSPNYPNPFNPLTTINYRVDQPGMVNLVIYDLLGRKVATLVDGVKTPGSYAVTWNARGFASGVYFYRIESGGGKALTQKMMLMK